MIKILGLILLFPALCFAVTANQNIGVGQTMVGATSSMDGAAGAAPEPLAGQEGYCLVGAGIWSSSCGTPGGVTSVGLSAPSYFTVSGSPVTSTGTLTFTGTSEAANLFLASPNGSSGELAPRAIVSADIPTLNQNTTGTASNVTGVVAIVNGGTGQTTANTAFNALSPMTTAGDLIFENSTPVAARLPIGSSTNLLTVSGGLPAWEAIPTWNQNTSGTAANITASSNSTLTTLSALSLPYSQLTGAPSPAWSLMGNSGTTAGTNFLGTTDAHDLVFKTNGTEGFRIIEATNNLQIVNPVISSLDSKASVDTDNRLLQDSAATDSVNWQSRYLYDFGGNASLLWDNRLLIDSTTGNWSVDWDNRILATHTGANALNWYNTYVESYLPFGINQTSPLAMLQVTSNAVGEKNVILKEKASQTADPFEIQNSSGTVLANFNAAGNLGVNAAASNTYGINIGLPASGQFINAQSSGLNQASATGSVMNISTGTTSQFNSNITGATGTITNSQPTTSTGQANGSVWTGIYNTAISANSKTGLATGGNFTGEITSTISGTSTGGTFTSTGAIGNGIRGFTNTSSGTTTLNNIGLQGTIGGPFSFSSSAGTVNINDYGVQGICPGTTGTNFTDTCYGVYANSSGGNTNWDFYSASGSPSYFSGTLEFNSNLQATQTGSITTTSCGTGSSVTSGSNDTRGTITVGTLATSCQVNLIVTYGAAPFCVVGAANSTAAGLYVSSAATSSFTVSGTTIASGAFTYQCIF